MSQTKNLDDYKLYLLDVGLFTTMLFNDKDNDYEDIYKKLLSDKVDINLEFLYENAVAQIIKATNSDLYFHTWRKKDSTHSYEGSIVLSGNDVKNENMLLFKPIYLLPFIVEENSDK